MGCIRDRMFPVSDATSPIEMIVLYAAWRAGAPADQIAPEARWIARLGIGVRGCRYLIGDTTNQSSEQRMACC